MTRPRLLIVDDDQCTRFALHALFTREGWDVAVAWSVAEGLARLDPAPLCLILDLNLPDGDGAVILKELREKRRGTRVAVCSGLDDPVRLTRIRGLKPDLMLWKPIELDPVLRLCAQARAAQDRGV